MGGQSGHGLTAGRSATAQESQGARRRGHRDRSAAERDRPEGGGRVDSRAPGKRWRPGSGDVLGDDRGRALRRGVRRELRARLRRVRPVRAALSPRDGRSDYRRPRRADSRPRTPDRRGQRRHPPHVYRPRVLRQRRAGDPRGDDALGARRPARRARWLLLHHGWQRVPAQPDRARVQSESQACPRSRSLSPCTATIAASRTPSPCQSPCSKATRTGSAR